MERLKNHTSKSHPKAPAVIWCKNKLVSASDYGHEETRRLLTLYKIPREDIDRIMSARTLAKVLHSYKEVVTRRSGERYFDHPSGVALLLLLELGITDPDILCAAMLHDVLEDVKIDRRELENLITGATSPEALRIVKMVTNPEKTRDLWIDLENKKEHYYFIWEDRKASVLKIADRIYNLRSLEVLHLDIAMLTDKHLLDAEKQIGETREFILPIAMKYGLEWILLKSIEKLEERASKVALHFLRKRVTGAAKI